MTMTLSFSGSDIRNSTEEELRESMRHQIQEQTANQQRESATMNDDCNHESPECRGPVTLWTRPTDWTRWPYCEYHGDRRDRKETQTRRRYR